MAQRPPVPPPCPLRNLVDQNDGLMVTRCAKEAVMAIAQSYSVAASATHVYTEFHVLHLSWTSSILGHVEDRCWLDIQGRLLNAYGVLFSSYKIVKGSSIIVEERISIHAKYHHASCQPCNTALLRSQPHCTTKTATNNAPHAYHSITSTLALQHHHHKLCFRSQTLHTQDDQSTLAVLIREISRAY